MADTAPKVSKSPAKKRVAKPKKPANHPKYSDMIKKAIGALKDRRGSSRQAILKYICANFKVDAQQARTHLKMALVAGVKNGGLKQSKGVGASGSFRLGDQEKVKKPKAKTVKKPKAAGAKKVKKPKTAAAKKSPKKVKKPKKAKSPAKSTVKKVAKPKAVKKSPAKKAAKPKKAKTPKKKPAKK